MLRLILRLRASGLAMGAMRFAALAQAIEYAVRAEHMTVVPLMLRELDAAYPELDSALASIGGRA
jgi:hypothetical protein